MTKYTKPFIYSVDHNPPEPYKPYYVTFSDLRKRKISMISIYYYHVSGRLDAFRRASTKYRENRQISLEYRHVMCWCLNEIL